jgi:hypothetical protein
LKTIVFDERLLNGMKPIPIGKTFDSGDLFTRVHRGEGKARIYAQAVHENRASPTLAMIAAFLGSVHAEVVAEGIEQSDPGL